MRDGIKAQLAADTSGFNDRLAAIALSYAVEPYAIDWSADSVNFLMGRVQPQALEETTVFTYPMLTIDTVRAQNTNRVKFATFAGSVTAIIDVHHSWIEDSLIGDFAALVDATEDAMIAALNDQNTQPWPPSLLWNGQVTAQRAQIVSGGLGWLQTATFICQFELTG